jgi:hypothetical protein
MVFAYCIKARIIGRKEQPVSSVKPLNMMILLLFLVNGPVIDTTMATEHTGRTEQNMDKRWDDCLAKGKALWEAHENWLAIGGGDNVSDQPAITDWYRVVELEDASWADDAALFQVAEEHAAMDQFRRYNVVCKERNKKGEGPGIPYINYFDLQDGIIVFGENFLILDTNDESRKMRLTDVVGKLYKQKTEEEGVDPTTLKTIWRANIKGQTSKHVIRKALQRNPGKFEFVPGEDDFNAILGTINGKGVVHFLSDWRGTLRSKTVEKVRVVELELSTLIYYLKDTVAAPVPLLDPVDNSPVAKRNKNRDKRKNRNTSSQFSFGASPSKKPRQSNSSP